MPNTAEAVVGYKESPFHLKIISILICLFALMVMAGWLTHNTLIVQINPSFETIKFNSALLLFLCGLALYLIKTHPHISCVLGIIVTFFAGFIGSQYIFNVNYGIDTFFVDPFVLKRKIYPGRFSPNTAFVYMCLGFSFILLSTRWKKTEKLRPFITATLASIVVALATGPLLSQLFDVNDPYIWGLTVGMAPHAAIIFLCLGCYIFFLSLPGDGRPPLWLPIPVLFVISMITLSFWQGTQNYHREQILNLVNAEARYAGDITKKYLTDLYKSVDRMAVVLPKPIS